MWISPTCSITSATTRRHAASSSTWNRSATYANSSARPAAWRGPKQVIVVKSGRHEAGRGPRHRTPGPWRERVRFRCGLPASGLAPRHQHPDLFHMSEILDMQRRRAAPPWPIIHQRPAVPASWPPTALIPRMRPARGPFRPAPSRPSTPVLCAAALEPRQSCGVLGDATPELYRTAIEACAHDLTVHGLLVLLSPQAMTDPTETARQLVPFARLGNKPVLAAWMGGEDVRAGRRHFDRGRHLPAFDAPEAAIRAFLNCFQYRSQSYPWLYETPRSLADDVPADLQRIDAVNRRRPRRR